MGQANVVACALNVKSRLPGCIVGLQAMCLDDVARDDLWA